NCQHFVLHANKYTEIHGFHPTFTTLILSSSGSYRAEAAQHWSSRGGRWPLALLLSNPPCRGPFDRGARRAHPTATAPAAVWCGRWSSSASPQYPSLPLGRRQI